MKDRRTDNTNCRPILSSVITHIFGWVGPTGVRGPSGRTP